MVRSKYELCYFILMNRKFISKDDISQRIPQWNSVAVRHYSRWEWE